MALNATHFEFADTGSTSVFKFRVGGDERHYVWFDYGAGNGSLFLAERGGPYRPEEELSPAPCGSLDDLLRAHGTDRAGWKADLLAQFGERIGWRAP